MLDSKATFRSSPEKTTPFNTLRFSHKREREKQVKIKKPQLPRYSVTKRDLQDKQLSLSTLPAGIKVYNKSLYSIVLRDGDVGVVLLEGYLPSKLHKEFNSWRKEQEKSSKLTIVFYQRFERRALLAAAKQISTHRAVIQEKHVDEYKKILTSYVEGEQAADRKPNPKLYKKCKNIPFIAIDSAGASFPEDLIYARRLPSGDVKIRFAYVDVSWLISKHGKTFKRAAKLGRSTYLRSTIVPMIGLNQTESFGFYPDNETRPSVIISLTVDRKGKIKDKKLYHAEVKNHKNFVYNDFNLQVAELENRSLVSDKDQQILSNINSIVEASSRLSSGLSRLRHVDIPENASSLLGSLIVESKKALFSILNTKKIPVIFRVKSEATKFEIKELCRALKYKNYNVNENKINSPQGIKDLFSAIQESGNFRLAKRIINTLLFSARYSTKNTGHAELKVDPSRGEGYGNIKPREFSGLVNQMQIASYYSKQQTMSRETLQILTQGRNILSKEGSPEIFKMHLLEEIVRALSDPEKTYECWISEVVCKNNNTIVLFSSRDLSFKCRWTIRGRVDVDRKKLYSIKLAGFQSTKAQWIAKNVEKISSTED